jgi:hypothetical protein
MSAGDSPHDGKTAFPKLVEKYRKLAEPLVEACAVDRAHTVPWLANRTRDCKTVFIDESIPQKLPKTGVDTGKTLPWHEIPECLAMDDGLPYDEGEPNAHADVATPLERAEVERQGADWAEYSAEMAAYIKEVDDEAMTDIPTEIDTRVFTEDDDKKTIDELIAAGDLDPEAGNRARGPAMAGARFLRFAIAAPISLRAEGDRTVDHIFSDESVARDGHTIATAGWKLDNFLKNPVYLWAHDSSSPPIGRVTRIVPDGALLRATVQYATADEYPFADTIFRLTKGGYINASSVSWLPIKWRYATDKARPGGVDFLEQELLEASAVPLPALASALVTARSMGIDTQPIFDWASRALDIGGFAVLPRRELEILRKESRMATARAKKAEDWKVGAARDLPVSDKDGWDGPAAAKRMLDAATKDDKIDAAEAKRGFLLYDSANPDLRGSYKEPFADLVDGKLTAIAGGVRAAAQRLPQVEGVGDEVLASARKVLDAYEKKLGKGDDKGRALQRLAHIAQKRGLNECADLCYHMMSLENLYDRCVREAEAEDDDSPMPARFRAWLDDGHRMLSDMTGEETQEHIDGTDAPPGYQYDSWRKSVAGEVRALLADAGLRAGKKYSAETVRCMRAIHEHIAAAHKALGDMIAEADDADPEEGDGDDEARALRARKAKALRIRQSAVGSRQ